MARQVASRRQGWFQTGLCVCYGTFYACVNGDFMGMRVLKDVGSYQVEAHIVGGPSTKHLRWRLGKPTVDDQRSITWMELDASYNCLMARLVDSRTGNWLIEAISRQSHTSRVTQRGTLVFPERPNQLYSPWTSSERKLAETQSAAFVGNSRSTMSARRQKLSTRALSSGS